MISVSQVCMFRGIYIKFLSIYIFFLIKIILKWIYTSIDIESRYNNMRYYIISTYYMSIYDNYKLYVFNCL
jgi:hypothetical protein